MSSSLRRTGLALAGAALIASAAQAQVVLFQDFDATPTSLPTGTGSSIPAGQAWTNVFTGTIENPAQLWTFTPAGQFTVTAPGITGGFAVLNSDDYGSGNTQNASLTSPTFSTTGASAVQVTYNLAYRNIAGQSLTVEGSIDGGSTWSTLRTYSGASVPATGVGTGFAPPYAISASAAETINAPTLANQASVRIRFRFVGDWGWYGLVDNVQVTSISGPTVAISAGSAPRGASATTLNIPGTLSSAPGSDVTITYSTANGTATAGTDYTAVTGGTVTVTAPATSFNLPVTIAGGTTRTPNRSFTVNITGVSGGSSVATTPSATGTILNSTPLGSGRAFGGNFFPTASFGFFDIAAPGASGAFISPFAPAYPANDIQAGGDFAGSTFTTFYTARVNTSVANNRLTSIDTTTFAETIVGTMTGLTAGQSIRGMKWDRVNNRMLVLGTTATGGSVYSVDLATGALTSLFTFTAPVALTALLVNPTNGDLYSFNFTADTTVRIPGTGGAVVSLGAIGSAHDGFLTDGDFDDSTGIAYITQTLTGGNNRLYTVNLTTGAWTLVSDIEASSSIGQSASFGISNPFVSSVGDWELR